jgi:hypothetical protein
MARFLLVSAREGGDVDSHLKGDTGEKTSAGAFKSRHLLAV